MKVIDLLNKIANGEEAPKKIKFDTRTYLFLDSNQYYDEEALNDEETYINKFGDDYTANFPKGYTFKILNDEVEIVEEDKKIKRIQSNGESLYSEYIGQWLVNTENYSEYDELLMNKINEIIDYLEENKK